MCLSIHQITLLVAIYTVVQGLVVVSLNIVLILVGTGALSDSSKTFVRHASYYLSCSNAEENNCSDYKPLNHDAVLGYEITYTVLHVLWLAGAVVLLTQLCKKKSWPDYVLWVVTCSLLIVFDTITGAFFCVDISNGKEDGHEAAVMMALISFRGIAFYVLNIVCLALVSYALRDTLAERATHNETKKSNKTTATTAAAAVELPQTQEPLSSNDDASSATVIPEPEFSVNRVEEKDRQTYVEPKDYQADPELIQRNQQVVAQIHQGHGPDRYRSPYGQPYPGRRLSVTHEYQSEDEDYVMYPSSHNERAIPRVMPAYSMPQRAPSSSSDYRTPYAYDNAVPLHDGYPEDDYYHGNTSSPPRVPPRVPARIKRNTSSRHSRPLPPSNHPAPPEDYDKKVPPPVPPKKAPYDVRPFSYVNPSFRPADHGDVSAMKSHSANIKKTLVDDLELLKMKKEEEEEKKKKEEQEEDESSHGQPHNDKNDGVKSSFKESNKEHNTKASDRPHTDGHYYDAPWNNKNSSHTERRPDQQDERPEEYEELMTAV